MLLILAFATEQERDAFEYIYEHYRKLMLHQAYRILQDYMLAEDAASEAFIRIYRNIHKIGDPTNPRCAAFVVTIVKNVALTMLKQVNAKQADELIEVGTDSFDVEEQVLARVSLEQVYGLLDGMNEELRSVFLLKYAYDLPHRQIGEMLGISENNVTVRLHRARKKLADLLKEEAYVSE